ncbi:MAG: PD-(D/E)XK nuclease family protein, partial [Duncaniella sp.]|nr:PD-(D/E)XK nuclease family protein [Duncaniella sp.]
MTAQTPSIDYEGALKLMLNAKSSDTYQRLLLKLRATSYQEIIGVSTKELPHSNMLAWLFSRQDLNN